MNGGDGVFNGRIDMILADFHEQMGLPEDFHDRTVHRAQ
jgi:hypothetical protein